MQFDGVAVVSVSDGFVVFDGFRLILSRPSSMLLRGFCFGSRGFGDLIGFLSDLGGVRSVRFIIIVDRQRC